MMGERHLGQAGRDELQDSHLGGRVLHGDAVGAELEVGDPALRDGSGVVQVAVHNFLGKREGPSCRMRQRGCERARLPYQKNGFISGSACRVR